ncbi:phosphate ABC transporter permease PstA [Halovulum sp. GXIMD14794]
MVAIADLSAQHGTEASARRLKNRRWAELRLKTYGILAILFAGLALVALMSTVVGNAMQVLTESYITAEVPLDDEGLDANDPESIARFNYDGLVKDVLKEEFPTVSGRTERRELYDLVSSGAQFELRQQVIDNPDLVGGSVEIPLLASDVTDLYLKGVYGGMKKVAHAGALSIVPIADSDNVRILTSANDFEEALQVAKTALREQALFQRNQARLQNRGFEVFTAQAENAETQEERDQLLASAQSRAVERDRLLDIADDLDARATQAGGFEPLDNSAPSVLLRVGDGWLKMLEVGATTGLAEQITPVEAVDDLPADQWGYYIYELPENARKITDRQAIWIDTLQERGQVSEVFNTRFFTASDSREPELAGIWGAIVGSFWTMLVTFLLAFPIGVGAAIYLEEFAPKNRITDFVEVNINNLAAVPSIVFGLLGLAVFLGYFGVPRSSPLAGGIVLALMTLPTIIIASRAAIRAVPPSIRDAALGLGASKLQTSFHHVLPLAMPGILTGTIIGMAQALGETAPLIMIGMVAFIVDIPSGVTDSATVLPVQVFRWSDFPERAFESRTAAAICVLLLFLVLMNALAVFLRKRFERRW